MRFLKICACLLAGCLMAMPGQAGAAQKTFAPLGLGTAGGLYSPGISPYDENLVLVSCDMNSVFRSLDGGENWELIHWKNNLSRTHIAPRPIFTPKRIYWVTGQRHICFSEDQGENWTTLPPAQWNNHPQEMKNKNLVVDFLVIPGKQDTIIVSVTQGLWAGNGNFWQLVSEKNGGPMLLVDGRAYATFSDGEVTVSKDSGATWSHAGQLPGEPVALAGTANATGSVLFASVKDKGLYRSKDEGKSWVQVKNAYENETMLAIPPKQTETVYAMQTMGVKHQQLLKSTNGGGSWEPVFRMAKNPNDKSPNWNVSLSWLQKELFWGYYFTRKGLAVSPHNPNLLMATTQGELFVSKDAGKSWDYRLAKSLSPLPDGTPRSSSIGLENTSTWGYYFDPHAPEREYIAYTDFGFARSLDNGKSWSGAIKGARWKNTFYQIAFDPDKPGRIYAATSNRHDIPHYSDISATYHKGGVVISDNHGANWQIPYKTGAPGALPEQVCTTILLDPSSPPDNRRLYAGIFGETEKAGVYVSEDGGKSWAQTAGQPGVLPNRHVYRLALHPKTGVLYCLVTAYRAKSPDFFNPEGGGIWVSGDKGKSWKHISKGSDLNRWATAFAFDPKNDQGLYVTACSPPGGFGLGGVYKTYNGGETWFHVLKDKDVLRMSGGVNYDHHMSVAVHPDNPDLVFSGTTLHGMFASRDAGASWQWVRDFPFANVQSINFDPKNTDRMLVTTFGAGVWEGSVKEALK